MLQGIARGELGHRRGLSHACRPYQRVYTSTLHDLVARDRQMPGDKGKRLAEGCIRALLAADMVSELTADVRTDPQVSQPLENGRSSRMAVSHPVPLEQGELVLEQAAQRTDLLPHLLEGRLLLDPAGSRAAAGASMGRRPSAARRPRAAAPLATRSPLLLLRALLPPTLRAGALCTLSTATAHPLTLSLLVLTAQGIEQLGVVVRAADTQIDPGLAPRRLPARSLAPLLGSFPSRRDTSMPPGLARIRCLLPPGLAPLRLARLPLGQGALLDGAPRTLPAQPGEGRLAGATRLILGLRLALRAIVRGATSRSRIR